MPNKTIYVSDSDQALYDRAQELAGGNLSSAIAQALRRFVEIEQGRTEGFDEIVLRVGPGGARKVRFAGVLLGEWMNSSWSRVETYHIYRSRTGKFVLHVERSAGSEAFDAQGRPAGWRSWLGLGDYSYATTPGEWILEVVDSLDDLRDKVPPQFFEMVSGTAQRPPVEDLDI